MHDFTRHSPWRTLAMLAAGLALCAVIQVIVWLAN
jgi:hypothetical protein